MEKVVSIILIVIIMAFVIWRLVRSYIQPLMPPRLKVMDKEEVQPEEITDENMEQMDIQLPDATTRTSLMVALHKLNLQYDFDEDQYFMVTYQGECFRIIAENDKPWIQIQDLWWYGASLDDIDNLALLHRAVNECNIRDVAKMVYTYNQEEHEIGVHTLCDRLWMPQIPDSAQYLQSAFDTMLRSHHFFFRMMEDLRREEYEKSN